MGHVICDVVHTQKCHFGFTIYFGHVLVLSEGIWQSNSQQFLLYTSQVNKCFFVINKRMHTVMYTEIHTSCKLLIEVTLKNMLQMIYYCIVAGCYCYTLVQTFAVYK